MKRLERDAQHPSLLRLCGFCQNCNAGRDLLSFFNSPNDRQTLRRHHQSVMIHGGIGSVFMDDFPLATAQVEGKCYGRRFGGLPVVADAVETMWIIRSTGEVDHLVFLGPAGGDAETRGPGMVG